MRDAMASSDPNFWKACLRLFVDTITVNNAEVAITGPKAALAKACAWMICRQPLQWCPVLFEHGVPGGTGHLTSHNLKNPCFPPSSGSTSGVKRVGAPVGTLQETRWLERRGMGWYAVREVPRPLRALLGKKRFVLSLHTQDVTVARARRHGALARFQQEIEAARGGVGPSPVIEAGLAWRKTLERIEAGDPAMLRAFPGVYDADATDAQAAIEAARDQAEMVLYDDVHGVMSQHGPSAAATLDGIARGYATPLLLHVDSWLAEGGPKGALKEKTKAQYRVSLGRLEAWCAASNVPVTVEAIDRKTAARFIEAVFIKPGVDRATANREITAASSYWTWLVRRRGVADNPWRNQSLSIPQRRATSRETKRPYSDAEVVTLLNGPADPEVADMLRVALLSGMRLEEIYRLRVADCTGGWFAVRESKTASGVRRVPIHSGLADIVVRRLKGKASAEYLFHEAEGARVDRSRSGVVSKRFGHYRKRLGIHDAIEGRRQSKIDQHSCRRWFITTPRNANIHGAFVAAVVGHQAGNLTDDVYHGGPSNALRVACVEAVRLPVEPSS